MHWYKEILCSRRKSAVFSVSSSDLHREECQKSSTEKLERLKAVQSMKGCLALLWSSVSNESIRQLTAKHSIRPRLQDEKHAEVYGHVHVTIEMGLSASLVYDVSPYGALDAVAWEKLGPSLITLQF